MTAALQFRQVDVAAAAAATAARNLNVSIDLKHLSQIGESRNLSIKRPFYGRITGRLDAYCRPGGNVGRDYWAMAGRRNGRSFRVDGLRES